MQNRKARKLAVASITIMPAVAIAVLGTVGASASVMAPAHPGHAHMTTVQTTDPVATVNAYFNAINLRDYQKAWNLGGKNTASSYASFVSGFKNTAKASVQVLEVGGDGPGVVLVRVTTLETNGSTKVFLGTYTVKNGVITEVVPCPPAQLAIIHPDTGQVMITPDSLFRC